MPVKRSHSILGSPRFYTSSENFGFALPLALALGLIMLAIAGASILVAQSDRNSAVQRRASGASTLVSDGAVARALLELSKPNNSLLLIRNYDPTDPNTGKNYLGADGTAKSGDESGTALDEWTSYDPSGAPCFQQLGRGKPNVSMTGIIGSNETYTIRAYRYDTQNKLGTLLVEGNYKDQSSLVAVTLSIEPTRKDFPGLFTHVPGAGGGDNRAGKLALRGRTVLGSNGNLYYPPANSADPTLVGSSAPGEATRPAYLGAIWAGPGDGVSSDNVSGKIFACELTPTVPSSPQGTAKGIINTSQTLSGLAGVTTYYQISGIDLANADTLTVDTTAGPVHLYLSGQVRLRDTAKILNARTDGQPPSTGDFRLMTVGDTRVLLYGKTCIQNAFLYSRIDQLELYTTGPGCPSGKNTNFEGVAWVEDILTAKNTPANRNVATYLNEHNTTVIPGITSGIAVPDDLSGLDDLLPYIDWPAQYRYGTIKNWRRTN
jgi:hypothetical protein